MLRRVLLHRGGASAAEFALVLPMLILFIFGIIDVGRYLWQINRAEKAAHMGVRMAVVTNPVSSTINDSYVGQCATPLNQGDTIPASCFTPITCSKSGANASCTSGTADTAAFTNVTDHMRNYLPHIQDSNVQIIYSPSGLGYAGDPNGPDVAPLVTVRLFGMNFAPTVTFTLGNVPLPEVRTSLTSEDATGSMSN